MNSGVTFLNSVLYFRYERTYFKIFKYDLKIMSVYVGLVFKTLPPVAHYDLLGR